MMQSTERLQIVREDLWNKIVVERSRASGASSHLYLEHLYEQCLYSLERLLFPIPVGIRKRLKVSSKLRQ